MYIIIYNNNIRKGRKRLRHCHGTESLFLIKYKGQRSVVTRAKEMDGVYDCCWDTAVPACVAFQLPLLGMLMDVNLRLFPA